MRQFVKPEPLVLLVQPTNWDACTPLSGLLSDAQCSARALKSAGSQVFSAGLEGLKSAGKVLEKQFLRARDNLTESIQTALKTAKERPEGLLNFHDLPGPWQINPHITKGYRFCETQRDCVWSVFKLTNESFNIWSHAVGFLFILATGIHFFPNSDTYLKTTYLDNFFILLFLLAAAKCMICSCTYHTMNSIADHKLNKMFACVDYTGISLFIAASIMSAEHIAFNCHPTSWWIYISNTSILGLIGTLIPWHPFFVGNEKAWLRVAIYGSMVITGVIPPMIHLSIINGSAWTYSFYEPLASSFLVYVIGALVYATKVPEKYIPGVFDFFGGSHNIWHVAVLGGIFFHYNALSEMLARGAEVASVDCRSGL